jgi:hypothetical protein
VGLTISPSAAADLQDYRIRVYRGGSLVQTLFTRETRPTYTVEDGSGSYTFDVAARDVFGQLSAASGQTAALTLTDLTQYVADLRAGLIHADSLGTAATTLAGLKDADLGVAVVSYAGDNAWRWTQGDWQEEITHQTTELILSSTASCYLGTSLDGATWSWFAGGAAAGGRWQPVAAASEAAAQAAATALVAGVWRVDLPAPRRCRYIRIGHRHGSTSYALREFFPSTLLRATYMQAESITAVNIAAGAIVADKIAANAIDAFVITGATIRTANSASRVEMNGTDLRVISGGVTRVQLDTAGLKTYDAAGNLVIQATSTTNGELWAASGRVRLTRTTGIVHVQPSPQTATYSPLDMLRADGVTAMGELTSSISPAVNTNTIGVRVFDPSGTVTGGTFEISAGLTSIVGGGLSLGIATATAAGALRASGSVTADSLNLGTASGAPAGSLRASGGVVIGDNTTSFIANGALSAGNVSKDWSPTAPNWSLESTLILSGNPHSVLAFHDSLDRVDCIRVGSGVMTLGHDAGFGPANIRVPGNATAFGGTPFGNQRVRIVATGDTSGHFPLAVVNSNESASLLLVRGDSWFGINAASWNNLSDARCKADVTPLDGALAHVRRWRPVRFRWADGRDDDSPHYGFIAQELQTVTPELVRPQSDAPGALLSVATTEAIALLAAAVQELAARVAALEATRD